MWAIFRLRFNFSGAVIQEYGVFLGIGGWVGEGKTNDNSLVITPGHGNHYWNNEISSPLSSPTQPPIHKKHPTQLI